MTARTCPSCMNPRLVTLSLIQPGTDTVLTCNLQKYRSDWSTAPSDLIPPLLSFNLPPPHTLPSSLTPNDSSDDEAAHPGHPRRSLHSRRPPALTVDTAMDVDMTGSENLSPWPDRLGNQDDASQDMQPSPIPHQLVNKSLSISGGRTATPIYGYFPRDSIQYNTMMDGGPPEGCSGNTFLQASSKPEADWLRRRRLPSPISEDGDASPFPVGSSPSSTRPHSPMSATLDPSTRQWLTVPEPDLEPTARQPGSPVAVTVDRTSSSAAVESLSDAVPRRTKISFSMGYRADCEKCRLRVPGHYSHIVRS